MATITQPKKNALSEFEALPEGTLAQLIGGEIVMSPSPTAHHQIAQMNLAAKLQAFVTGNKLETVIGAPIDVYFSDEEVYQPDIVFISREKSDIIKEKIYGVPDLVVEVLSPSSAYHDLKYKWRIYETSGVQEYWIADPVARSVEIYENRKGEFRRISQAFEEGTVRSRLLKVLAVEVAEVFANA